MDTSTFAVDWIACFACLGAAYGGLRFFVDVFSLTRYIRRAGGIGRREGVGSVGRREGVGGREGVGSVGSTGPATGATTGPATTGPATTGPATTGPATTGPATRPQSEQLYPRLAVTGGKLPRMSAITVVQLLDPCEFTSGTHAGKTFLAVIQTDPSYSKWILEHPANTKKEIYRLYMVYVTLQDLL